MMFVEYLDDASVMKNASVLYKIEPLREGEIGILRTVKLERSQRDAN